MKWNCEIIQDLLPLYEEGLCSPSSRQAVEAHLCECESCRQLTGTIPIPEPEESPAADRAVAKCMKKVKRRWLTSLVATLLLIPTLLLSVNQYWGRGICWTNVDDVFTAWRFLRALEKGNWEKAAAMHDYSDDYESILEALELPVSAWGASFTSITLDGESWMLKSYLDCNAMEGAAPEAIFQFIYNRVGTVMVPLELWKQVIAVDPAAVQQNGWLYWINDELYGQMTTPWGEFVISEALHYDNAADYCSRLDLVPTSVYEEATADLETEARELYDSTHAAYDYVSDMTEAEFLEYMEQSYAADLAQLDEMDISFDCTGYHGAYRLWEDDGWHVQFGVTITYQDEPLETTISISTEDGKVHIVSLSHREQVDWLDQLDNALYPSAHPDY